MNIRKKSMQEAISYYAINEEITIADCAKMFNVDRGTLGFHLRKMNLNTDRNKYSFNENFFEDIDNEIKAYWLGFLLADGSVDKKTNKISIGLSSVDKNHLEKFQQAIESNHEICDYLANNKYATSDINICSEKMKEDLKRYNIIPNKSKQEQICDLPEHLIKHYIRGFFDGDGWITSYDRRPQDRCKNQKWELGFGSSFEVVNFISEHFAKVLDVNYKEPKQGVIYRIRYSSNKDIAKIVDYIYNDPSVCLERKHQKVLEFCRLESKLQKTQDY